MPCFHPLKGYRSQERNPSGKRSLVFTKREGYTDKPIEVPCGGCIGCRLERSRQWAIRCVHEAKMHKQNCFLTLTYNDENLPKNGSLIKGHYRDFMKRLRAAVAPTKIRYFHCGEYGDQFGRPHYHACLFGYDFPDKQEYKKVGEQTLYTSKLLEQKWGHGFATIGELTFDSAAYVARYVTKKITGPHASFHYSVEDEETGDIVQIQPEYVTMSRRPGIAKGFYEKFKKGVFPSDSVVMKGREMKPPKFYAQLYEREQPREWDKLKAKRKRQKEKREERLRAKGEDKEKRLREKEEYTMVTLKQKDRNRERR